MSKGLFDPDGGAFAENIRKLTGDDSALRESMKHLGWLEQLPAWADENGVVIIGHRRMKIAKELGSNPVIQKYKFGNGDEADAKRLQLAIASNTGGKGLTPKDRQRIAEYLYTKEKGWTVQRIAEALGVGKSTIERDLGNLPIVGKLKHTKTATNPKGAGRPKNRKTRATTPEQDTAIAKTVLDDGKSWEETGKEFGVSDTVVRRAVATEEGVRKAKEDPEIDRATLSMTVQQKLDAAIRQHKAKLDIEFEQRVQAECKAYLDSVGLPHYLKKLERLERLITARKGVMDKTTYNKIRWCLHSDHVQDQALKRRYDEAFTIFNDLEKLLLSEKESPSGFQPLPKNFADLMKQRAKFKEERAATKKAREAGKTKVAARGDSHGYN